MSSEEFKVPQPISHGNLARAPVQRSSASSPSGKPADCSLHSASVDDTADCRDGNIVGESAATSLSASQAACQSDNSSESAGQGSALSGAACTGVNHASSQAHLPATHADSLAVYSAPAWSGRPQHEYWLEVVRGGVPLTHTHQLHTRSHTVFGRADSCDVTLQHPSVSRHHAVLVFRAESSVESAPSGYYLYDLSSTHGTWLNKRRLQPRTYTRIRVGHLFRLAGSTRLFILHGPDDDQERESELSVSELKQLAAARKKVSDDDIDDDRGDDGDDVDPPSSTASAVSDRSEGINWGMAEDACEETDLSYNPFALSDTDNSHLYLNDPKRTLRGWFEREGLELEYVTEEVSTGHHVCRVTLPISSVCDQETSVNGSVVAEVNHTGRKKDAVIQCAQQACRILDRAGLLRRAVHDSRGKRARCHDNSDDDDNDTFVDRTGHVEMRRERRKQQLQSGSEQGSTQQQHQPLSHEQLTGELSSVESEIERLQSQLSSDRDQSSHCLSDTHRDDTDALDTFMQSLRTPAVASSLDRRRFRQELTSLQKQRVRLRRLVDVTRANTVSAAPARTSTDTAASVSAGSKPACMIVVGKRKAGGARALRCLPAPSSKSAAVSRPDDAAVDVSARASEQRRSQSETTVELEVDCDQQSRADNVSDDTVPTHTVRTASTTCRVNQQAGHLARRDHTQHVEQLKCDEQYESHSAWTPPVGQTGDGRTSLNDKFGY